MAETSRTSTGPAPVGRRVRASTEEAVHHVEHLIFNGDLSPGDALPSEVDLAAEIGVSRLTMREGIKSLQARGLLTVVHGRRSVVAHANARPLRDFFSSYVRRDADGALEILDVRLAVEVRAAEMAATAAGPEDLEAMQAALDVMAGTEADAGSSTTTAFNEADIRFHAAVARASGNRVLALLVEGMEQPLQQTRLLCVRGFPSVRHDASLLDQHRRVHERIVAGDPEGAAAAMRDHLLRTREYVSAPGPAAEG